jgi:predicted double-glycine peptidase
MNFLGAAAVVLSVVAFAVTHRRLRSRPLSIRLLCLCGFAILAVPSLWFAVYYLHVLPEQEWLYTVRSWPGSELLVVFLGCAGGAAAALLPRLLLGVPLFAALAPAALPYLKPLLAPLPDDAFQGQSQAAVCLQSTPSTCGPASVTTILRRLGVSATERGIARAAFSYRGGTEAWYLARYVRSRGLSAHFDFRPTFSPAAGLPALVGVRIGGAGHFIAVLDLRDDQVTFADPMIGEEHLSLAGFQRHYDFTGFHMVIHRAEPQKGENLKK